MSEKESEFGLPVDYETPEALRTPAQELAWMYSEAPEGGGE